MDVESLFGSPPSSPRREERRSPSLALPCQASEQVGATIARPGTPSELADNVANMSHSQQPRPKKTAPRKKRKTVASSRGLGPQGPAVTGLLRNQPSLLGAAGTIGRVNVANLNIPHGSSYNTPILVHDGTEAPLGISYSTLR